MFQTTIKLSMNSKVKVHKVKFHLIWNKILHEDVEFLCIQEKNANVFLGVFPSRVSRLMLSLTAVSILQSLAQKKTKIISIFSYNFPPPHLFMFLLYVLIKEKSSHECSDLSPQVHKVLSVVLFLFQGTTSNKWLLKTIKQAQW